MATKKEVIYVPFFAVAGLVVGFLGLCLSTYLGLKSISFTRQQLIITNKAVAELDDIANGVKISAEKTYELIGRNIVKKGRYYSYRNS